MKPIKTKRARAPKWSARAEAFAALMPRDRLHAAPRSWAEKRRKSEVWGVAFSGGADSLALLLLLWAHWPERREHLVALHFNHGLRGRESDADETFCRKVCAALGVKLRVGKWRKPTGPVSEAEARAARHAFFAKELARAKTRVVWFGHQQDDIAETLLMRLARGSGSAGLAAPRPVQSLGEGTIYLRPLLSVKKQELVAALAGAGVEWREDATNAADEFFRNRIRNRVIPAWQDAAGRDALAGAALTRELLDEDDLALEQWVDRLGVMAKGKLNVGALAGMPRAVTRRALHRWLLDLKQPVSLSRQGFEGLLGLVERGTDTRFSLGKHGFAVLARGELSYRKA
jgi:tRNA(Ile)-lysidine synthase